MLLSCIMFILVLGLRMPELLVKRFGIISQPNLVFFFFHLSSMQWLHIRNKTCATKEYFVMYSTLFTCMLEPVK